jgi:hypothetical protein
MTYIQETEYMRDETERRGTTLRKLQLAEYEDVTIFLHAV